MVINSSWKKSQKQQYSPGDWSSRVGGFSCSFMNPSNLAVRPPALKLHPSAPDLEQREDGIRGTPKVPWFNFVGTEGHLQLICWVQAVLQLGKGDYCSRSQIASLHCFFWQPGPDLRDFCQSHFQSSSNDILSCLLWGYICITWFPIFLNFYELFIKLLIILRNTHVLVTQDNYWGILAFHFPSDRSDSFHHPRMFFNLTHSITS